MRSLSSLSRPTNNISIDFASLLRLPPGLMVLGHHVHHVQLRVLLRDKLGYDTPALTRLFDNKDHQNVPNAVSLVMAVRRLADLPELLGDIEYQNTMALCFLVASSGS